MSTSAIPHVVAFLTRPLVAEFAPAAISSAQLILTASLASQQSATFALSATSTPPAPLFAASIGAGIPWAAWMAKLSNGADVLLFYGPGFVKVRLGSAAVTDVWTEETQGSIVPISRAQTGRSPLLQENTGARLRAMLLSARVRSMRRHQTAATAAAVEPIRIPSLLASCISDSDDSDDSDSDYAPSDSGSASSASSKFTSYSNDSLTSAGSPPATPAKSAPMVLPSVAKYRAPRPSTARRAAPAPIPAPAPVVRATANAAKKDTTAYLYQGGVTRVMTGGVMLGARHVVRSTRS
ncbi:hypothetical protein C8R46DRAFT_1118604 [Mycena filopes]|nr:hypothetical protein C8R46DRAFT_1118604 [Mycena filopes]